MKHSFTKQDIQKYGSTGGHIPRGLHNLILIQDWYYAAFKRLQRMKDGK